MSTIFKTFEIDGVKTNMTSVVLSDPTGTYGVKRDDTDAVVVADGTAMTNDDTGIYSYTFADPDVDLTYTYWLEFVYGGETYHIEGSMAGPTAALDGYALATLAHAREYVGTDADDSLLTRLINAASDAIEKECGRKFLTRVHTTWVDGSGKRKLSLPNFPITSLTRCAIGARDAISVTNTNATTEAAATFVQVTSTGVLCTRMAGATTINTLLFADYTTLTTMAGAINALGNGWVATVLSGYGDFASAELKPMPGSGCLSSIVNLQLANLPEDDIEIDEDAQFIVHPTKWTQGYQNVFVNYTAGYTEVPDDLEQVCLEVVKDMYDAAQTDGMLQSEKLGDYSYTRLAQEAMREKHLMRIGPWRRIVF